jgi:CheY-like chemotaxis protein
MKLSGRALVVDDLAQNRELLVDRLEVEGLASDAACDGRDALAMLEARPYDIVFLDLIRRRHS